LNNLDRIKEEFEQHKGEFVITENNTVDRFVGIAEDESDYYYILYNGRKIHWYTFVGKLVYLKGKIDDKDYIEFIRIAELNHADRQVNGENHIKYIMQLKNENDKYLADYYFEMN